ncbi:MAG: glycosyltransferase family 1 protein [Patescibacteria group bacterium]|jgi:glycosyltransferase involved in cell wall biosynthesis
MKIAIDARGLLGGGNLTGVGFYAYKLLEKLFELDQENQYVLFSNSIKENKIAQQLVKGKNTTYYSKKIPNKLFNFSLKFLGKPYLDRLVGGADIFWFPNLNFWSVSPGCPTIVTVHDLSFIKTSELYSPKMRLWHKAIGINQKLKNAAKIVAVSQSTKDDLITTYDLLPDKIKVIYPGPIEVKNYLPKTLPFDLPDKYILFLGTLEPRKNIIGIIKAFHLLNNPQYHLVLAGGAGWQYSKLIQLVRQLKLGNRVKFLGYVTPAQQSELYQRADLFVWPSFYEGFGFPPLEAMRAGVPVIASANSSMPEVLAQAAILVDPYNIKEIAQTMHLALSDNNLRSKLIANGFEQVKKYSWEQSAKQMLEVFREFNLNVPSGK